MDIVELVIQGGAVGLLAFVLWMVFKRQAKQQDDANERNTREHTEIVGALHDNQKVTTYMAALLIQHDATVRGENSESVGTTADLVSRAQKITQANGIGI